MPKQNESRHSFWDDRKSIALTRAITAVIFFVCIAVAVMGPAIVDWLIVRGRIRIQGPAVRWVMLVLGYLLAALALWMLYNLFRFLTRLENGQVFVPQTVAALRRISGCCAAAAVICIPSGAVLYFPFACMGIAAGFMALIVQVVKHAFEQALRMKNELDFTI